MHLKCVLYRMGTAGYEILQTVYPNMALKDFKSIKLFQTYPLYEL